MPGAPGTGAALVRVRRVGICGIDFHAFKRAQPFFSYPRMLGHELAVEVVELGAGVDMRGLKVGDVCHVNRYLNHVNAARAGRHAEVLSEPRGVGRTH